MQHIKTDNGLEWLEFDLLSDIPGLKHAVFLRHGGLSQDPFKSLNVSYDVDDKTKYVDGNIKIILDEFKRNCPTISSIKWAKQNHKKTISLITPDSPQETNNCDALVTTSSGVTLMIKHADCQAAIFYDPKHRVVANVHSGWRGSALNIYGETVQYLKNTFGTNPSELLVCISPSLGPDDAQFVNYKEELPEEFWSFQTAPYYFDFWSISEMQLQNAGVLSHHIEIAKISTYSNPHDYFSYRKNNETGRHGTCVALL